MNGEQPATKADLAAVKDELKGDIAALKNELKGDIASVKDELKGDIASVKNELKSDIVTVKTQLKDELTETMRGIETNLLTEFHRYAKAQQVRLHSLEVNDSDVKLRLASIEERILALEMRRPPTV